MATDDLIKRTPFTLFVLKVASTCNLNCKYCYMYNLGDSSYLRQPAVMSDAVIVASMEKIRAHCRRHKVAQVGLVLHGGEPMLAGRDFFRRFVKVAREILGPEVQPHFMMQTNGTLIDREWLDTLGELEIGFGISLDGPPAINDENRVNHGGRGSYRAVRAAIDLALADPRCAKLFGSVLTVVNLACDPLALYRHFKELGLRGADFLLPDSTYDRPPPGVSMDGDRTPYADWLITIFDEWFEAGNIDFRIRLFEDIIALVFGCPASTDNIGGRPNDVLVIETDGGIEPVDVLKGCGDGFTKIGMNVLVNEIDDAYDSPLLRTYQIGAAALCDTCSGCAIRDVCGGGYLPHRYSSRTGFANPSVYCHDLAKLITHVQARVLETLPEDVVHSYSLAPIDYHEVWRAATQHWRAAFPAGATAVVGGGHPVAVS
jgi:uncharacterized protein